MAEYKRAAFDPEWWDSVSKYIEQHPEEGFEPEEVKEFIKYVVNQRINLGPRGMTEEDVKDLIEELRSD